MYKSRKILSLSLAAFIALSPMAIKAEDLDNMDTIPVEEEVEMEQPNYIEFNGKITEINSKGEFFSILAENDLENALDKLVAYISEDTVLLNDDTMDFVTIDNLKEGMEVSIFYHKETPMLMSYPPQLTPNVVVVRNKESKNGILVDKFDEDLLNGDKSLRLLLSDKTEIVDIEGNKVDKEHITNKNLVIFYDMVLESYPAQIPPKRVIVLKDEEVEENNAVIETLDKIAIDGEKITLDHPIYTNEEKVFMVPLRQIAEKLDYKVEWDQETQSAELTKGPHWTRVTIGKDNYNFARMMVELGTAPELTDSKTYVPLSFLEEILKVNIEITEDGILNINQTLN